MCSMGAVPETALTPTVLAGCVVFVEGLGEKLVQFRAYAHVARADELLHALHDA